MVEELNLFQKPLPQHQKDYYNYGDAAFYAHQVIPGIKVELYPDNASFNMPISEHSFQVGEQEIASNFHLKNLVRGETVLNLILKV
jgi:hypothetical protein